MLDPGALKTAQGGFSHWGMTVPSGYPQRSFAWRGILQASSGMPRPALGSQPSLALVVTAVRVAVGEKGIVQGTAAAGDNGKEVVEGGAAGDVGEVRSCWGCWEGAGCGRSCCC